MSNHYEKDLTEQEYQEEYDAAVALTFGQQGGKKVYASLESLEGVVEVAVGTDEQHCKEVYIEHIENLIRELQEKKVKIMYNLVDLEYTHVGGA